MGLLQLRTKAKLYILLKVKFLRVGVIKINLQAIFGSFVSVGKFNKNIWNS